MKRMLPAIVTGIILAIYLWGKLRLGLIRYFDADELAYLHWAHNVFAGSLPYRDFLLYIPPVFLYVLAPIYAIFHGASVLLASRVVAWGIFVGICVVSGLIFIVVRKKSLFAFLLPGLILSFLPLPSDKMLEIRPDNLATLVVLAGLFCQIRWIQGNLKAAFWSGLLYSVSLLILPKTLPSVAVGVVAALFTRNPKWFWGGMISPFFAFGLWAIISGSIDHIWYSVVQLPLEVNKLGDVYPILPWHFFYPNTTYYGGAGWNSGLLANHAVWFIGLMTGVVRLMTPYIPFGKKGVVIELLIAGSMIAYSVAFLYGYPMRHAQYLIPIAVFVAWYSADAVYFFWMNVSQSKIGLAIGATCLLGLLLGLSIVSQQVTSPKFALTNQEDLRVLERALTTIPKDAYVLDLVGSTIYFKDPYYVCCVPFGQWEPYLSKSLPNVSLALEQTGTQFIYEGRLGRVETLGKEGQEYIRRHFVSLEGVSGFLVRKK